MAAEKLNTVLRSRWENYWNTYPRRADAFNYRLHLYRVEACRAAQELTTLPPGGKILSVGTGLGEVEIELLSCLSPTASVHLVTTDMVHQVLKRVRNAAGPQLTHSKMLPTTCNCSSLPFADATFDGVVSFGRIGIVAHPDVTPEAVRVTKRGGTIVVDFTNALSPYDLLVQPSAWKRLLRHAHVLPDANGYHQLGYRGIRRFYEQFGLELVALHRVGAAPPLRNALSVAGYDRCERYWPLKSLFGRILLAVFKRR